MQSCATAAARRIGTVYLSSSRSIYENLALEEYLFRHHDLNAKGEAALIWSNTPTVVIGRHQNVWLEANVPFLREKGIDLARRHSGGGTVYHDMGNLNVSFLTTQKRHCRPRNLRLLADALNLRLGTNVVPNGRDDLILEPGERKVSGTAARISHGRAYHHLTLLVDVDVERLKTALRSPYADSIETNATRSVRAKAVGHLSQDVPGLRVDEAQRVVIDAVCLQFEELEICHVENPLDEQRFPGVTENLRVLQSEEWIFGKCPKL
ncbi:CRE-GIP-2 protein [Aphelenchoides avenae]|nr:CRE-GIP-2 protein [Aphelenchus avenae]